MKSKQSHSIYPIINYWEYDKEKMKFSFYKGSDLSKFNPASQSYAICFTEQGKIVIGFHPGKYHNWLLPGGAIEENETAQAALKRELDEEVSLEVLKCKLIGAQKVEYINSKKKPHFQLRYFALVKLHKLTADPDNNLLWKRKLVTLKQFPKYIKWGFIGEDILNLAYQEFLKTTHAKNFRG